MKIEINKSWFDSLYNKAKKSFYTCIRLKENAFLQQEIKGPMESITAADKSIKIVFSGNTADMYVLEICLTLLIAESETGKYIYYENEGGVCVDDSLVFY